MFNLKVGSVVYHKGVKRQVTRIVRVFDEDLLILEGFPFIVRGGSVKPVIRVTDRVRAKMLLDLVNAHPPFYFSLGWRSYKYEKLTIQRSEYDAALALIDRG